ncbi:MAG: terminase large subunit [Clostridiales bacterium]|jgi:phage terminase large subunit-like protein|nr:terminase large subunit [Clostridiales bacterium]
MLNETVNGAHSFLIEYYNLCKSGRRVIGKELETTLDALIAEMDAPEYRFNIKKPHRRISFIEKELRHSESPFAGEPFLLTIEQKAFTEAVFGFEYFDPEYKEWVRRFNEVLFLVARKNGKTPFVAALALAEWYCGERGQKAMCASNDYEQAGIAFNAINDFREESAAVERVTRKNNFGIFWGNRKQRRITGKHSKQNKGSIKKMSAKMGAKEGRNLKIAIVDEVHEMKDRSTVLPLISSVTTQKEPLYFEITSEGVVVDGYLDERLADARKRLKGELEPPRPRWLVWLYTQDSESEVWADESSWVKSNPLLGVCKKWSLLRERVDKARTNGAERAYTLAKEFNIKTSRPSAWLPDEVILNDLPTFTLEEFRGCWCISGADLSETNDLSAVTLLFMKPGDPVKYFYTMYFVPKSKAKDYIYTESPSNPEKKNYTDWQDGGYCRIMDDDVIPDDAVANYLYADIYKKYNIRPFRAGYDDWHAKEFVRVTAGNFGAHVPDSVSMTPAALDFATRELENDLRGRRCNYNQNPICIWNLRNAALRTDSVGRVMPIKLQGYIGNKIDGTISKVIAYTTLRHFKGLFMAKVG